MSSERSTASDRVARRDEPGQVRAAKPERLNLRLTAEQKRTIERAAALAGQSLTDYVLATVGRTARREIRDWEVLRLADRDRDLFLAALDRPAARPLPGLRKATARHRKALG